MFNFKLSPNLVPPFHPNNVEEVAENVLRHGSLNLQCDFKGHPSPKLMWIKGIEPISIADSSRGLHLTDNNQTLVGGSLLCVCVFCFGFLVSVSFMINF